jgi:hypothetical protein
MAKVLLKNVRLSFPDLFKAGTPPPGSTSGPKFGGQFIMAPDSDAFKVAQAEFIKVANEKFGANAAAILAELPKDKKCLRRGDGNLDKAGAVRNGYAGNMYITARNKARPVVVDRNRTPLGEADGKPYGGCFVNATVDIYAHDKPGLGKRVDATLLAVQFVQDGESFGGGVGSADDFEDLPDEGVPAGTAAGATAAANYF